jgi:hypothetical protein
MKNSNLAKSNLFIDEVNIDFNMLSSVILHWVAGHIKCINVNAINNGDQEDDAAPIIVDVAKQFKQQHVQPLYTQPQHKSEKT